MEKIDRGFLENTFGTSPDISDLEAAKELIDEWIIELKEKQNESHGGNHDGTI